MYYDHMDGSGGSGWVAMLIIVLLLIALAAGVVWAFVKNARPYAGATPARPEYPSAAEILDERLARGEIDLDEYRERRATLRESDA
jgi:putative membrane protein